ncbi:MAG: hypothetical protein AAF371_09895 [Pseudomonadota bacterium]
MKYLLTGISLAAMLATGVSTGAYASDEAHMDQITITGAWRDAAPNKEAREPRKGRPARDAHPRDVVKREPRDPNVRMLKDDLGQGGANAFVDQIGHDNQVDIRQGQAGAGAIADVVQRGDDNIANVRQRAAEGAPGDYAVITTFGSDNQTIIDQRNNGRGERANKADIQQGNDGSGQQIGDAGTVGDENYALIRQDGWGNTADINQVERGGTGQRADGNSATIRQFGALNEGRIDQISDDHMASQVQRGRRNEASTTQLGSLGSRQGHMSRITQDGRRNDATTVQAGESQVEETMQVGNDNAAYTNQDGVGNESVTWQMGDRNMASTIQDGEGNDATTSQIGNDNMAATFQFGDFNLSAIEQTGNDNVASVVQNGGDYANIQQWGGGNIAAVAQGGR